MVVAATQKTCCASRMHDHPHVDHKFGEVQHLLECAGMDVSRKTLVFDCR